MDIEQLLIEAEDAYLIEHGTAPAIFYLGCREMMAFSNRFAPYALSGPPTPGPSFEYGGKPVLRLDEETCDRADGPTD
jgi:hypothetical protein